ncbi:hypothetical protein C3747_43g243 [Trypanosoma cruzi]|uniref:Uncharacterized protein n=2 Tax=Trypanosoma cruzi TaxID=5693 RepID=Q4DG24_TRYCC|nr:hypothetical protein, conserved [Trypanosoma cruzi]EAN91482.1 hypothetical protein, conserved [Trypanosoma cruzi]PWV13366.1 hypothetical protein C3747_43g243 [Trypanosoma cruzi]|eukprot:XP_813333.1 hypothetical protein [Trypanosoma cruzi strain CL Brener]
METRGGMAVHLLPRVCATLPLRLLDCSSCALLQALGQKPTSVTFSAAARFAVDAITGAVFVGGATETLVPFTLLQTLHESVLATSSEAQRRAAWEAVSGGNQLVVLVEPCDVPRLIKQFPQYKKVCMCVPSGPLASRMLFGQKHLEEFYAEDLTPAMAALSSVEGYSWTAWLRSSLTCRFEGLYVPSIRVAESVAHLLSSDGGCERVVLEEGIRGLTPRWLETVMKTTSSCGVPLERVTLALCRNEKNDGDLFSRAMGMGIGSLAASTVPAPLFAHTEELVGIDDVVTFATGWNDVCGGISAEELASLDDCIEYCGAMREEWDRRWRGTGNYVH